MEKALDIMQNALCFKRQKMDEYIEFISHFGPALTGMSFWNNNKTSKLVSELLTITDEAFIHLCIINYSATWKAQEQKKSGDTNVQVPVSVNIIHWIVIACHQQMAHSIIFGSIQGSPRLPTRLTN